MSLQSMSSLSIFFVSLYKLFVKELVILFCSVHNSLCFAGCIPELWLDILLCSAYFLQCDGIFCRLEVRAKGLMGFKFSFVFGLFCGTIILRVVFCSSIRRHITCGCFAVCTLAAVDDCCLDQFLLKE